MNTALKLTWPTVSHAQVTNTICQKRKVAQAQGKLESMDVSPLLAESIRRMHNGESISLLFTDSGPATFA